MQQHDFDGTCKGSCDDLEVANALYASEIWWAICK